MDEERVDAAAARQRWEYRCEFIDSKDSLKKVLNEAGGHYWELVDVNHFDGALTAIFKRPRGLFASHEEPNRSPATAEKKQT